MLVYNDDLHEYRINDKVIPSVTQILSSVGTKSKNGSWNSISGFEHSTSESGMEFGTEFHKIANNIIKGLDCEYDDSIACYVIKLLEFLEEFNVMPMYEYVEKPMYNKFFGYAGTPDLPCKYRNKNIMIDWKTGQFKESYYIQTSAYTQFLPEMQWETWTVIISEKNYEIKKRRCSEVKFDFNKFISILNVYKMNNR